MYVWFVYRAFTHAPRPAGGTLSWQRYKKAAHRHGFRPFIVLLRKNTGVHVAY